MSKREDLSNKRFGRLVVIDLAGTKKGQTMWRCVCDCGREKVVTAGHLKSGHTTSCGCYNREQTKRALTKHGKTGTRLHNIWFCMKARCYNTKHDAYKDYGGRGIIICDEWKDSFNSFYNWALANGYGDNKSIDRIDNNGNYCPENCRWSDRREQNSNKRSNHYITFDGKTMTLREWEGSLGFNIGTLSARINKLHWPVERALTTPTNCKL